MKRQTFMKTMRMDADVVDAITAVASADDRTFTAQVDRILRQWLVANGDDP